jgi:hypothetical protein
MTSTHVLPISIVVIVVVALAIVIFMRNRTQKLHNRSGAGYNPASDETKSRYGAERLEKRVERYPLRRLSSIKRDHFKKLWGVIQTKFVDDPAQALSEADQLLEEVMSARGYPKNDFEQRAREMSGSHAIVVRHYCAGHDISVRHFQGKTTTDDLRQGMIHYRALFNDLMAEPERSLTRAGTVKLVFSNTSGHTDQLAEPQ